MTTPVNITLFNEDTEFDVSLLNANLRKLAAAINTIAGTQMITYQSLPTDEGSGFLPITGGTLQGALVGPSFSKALGGERVPMIGADDVATTTKVGVVKQGKHVSPASNSLTAEQAINGLIDSLRESGVIADAST